MADALAVATPQLLAATNPAAAKLAALFWPWPIITTASPSVANSTYCDHQRHLTYVFGVGLLTIAASLVISFNVIHLLRRVKCKKNLDISIPVDFFSATPYRFIYCVTLSSWAADVFHDGLNGDLYYHSSNGLLDSFLQYVLTPIVIILRQGLFYFPMIASIDTSFPLLGHCVGFIYTALVAVRGVYNELVVINGCSYKGKLNDRDIGISLGVVFPIYLGYLVAAGWFFYHAAMETALVLCTRQSKVSDDHRALVYSDYVRKLLRNKQCRKKFVSKIRLFEYLVRGLQYVLPFNFNKQVWFPLPFLASLSMSFTLLYQICVVLVSYELITIGNTMNFIDSFDITVRTLDDIFPWWKNRWDNIFYDIKSFAQCLRILLPLCHWGSWWCTFWFTLYMIQNFHKHLLRAARGDLSFILASEPLPSVPHRLAAAMRYIPFQVGHIITSFVMYSLIGLVLGMIGWTYYYFFKNYTFYGIHLWCIIMIPYMWASALHTAQLFLCRYVFLRDGWALNENETSINIRFHHLYLLFTYFFLFFDVIYSIVVAVLRFLGPLFFSIIMLFRLDRDLYFRGMEGWDLSHRTYVGYLYFEYSMNNAVLRTFVNLLALTRSVVSKRECVTMKGRFDVQTRGDDYSDKDDYAEDSSLLSESSDKLLSGSSHLGKLRSRRVRNRWLVAYTLLRNPQLQELTASRIKMELSSETSTQ